MSFRRLGDDVQERAGVTTSGASGSSVDLPLVHRYASALEGNHFGRSCKGLSVLMFTIPWVTVTWL